MTRPPKRLLMIVLEFPPALSAGVQRPLKFAEYLPEHGWEPIVLTTRPRAYTQLDPDNEVPAALKHVYRTPALHAARDLSFKGRYLSWTAQPDPWWSWALSAIPMGRRLIRELQPAAIWSTYPATISHYIGYRLARASGLPWIADFRDPFQIRQRRMPTVHRVLAEAIERRTLRTCTQAVFTTPRARALYERLYPDVPADRMHTIPNGFDEGNFAAVSASRTPREAGLFQLLHSGALYAGPGGRDPAPVFEALAMLRAEGAIGEGNFELLFRGAHASELQRRQIEALGIEALVRFAEPVGYAQSLSEMLGADGLLLLQGSRFDNQVPGKSYEYIRAGKPIVAVTPADSATADSLSGVDGVFIGDEPSALAAGIREMLERSRPLERCVEVYSRRARTAELAARLDAAIDSAAELRVGLAGS